MIKQTVSNSDLHRFVRESFESSGISAHDSKLAATVLVEADLRGYESHGVLRLPIYLEQIKNNKLNKAPLISENDNTKGKAIGVVDGDNGMGLVVAPKAMDIAIKKAKKYGIGCVTVKHSNHYGIAQYSSLLATSENMVGVSMTNTAACVSHSSGKGRLMGTNPICISFPYQDTPFISDFSTPVVSYGKLQIAQYENREIPIGWAIDENGNDTRSPYAIENGGTLLPLGSDSTHSNYKGMSLGVAVDALCSLLPGAAFLNLVPHFANIKSHINNGDSDISSRGAGHFLMAIDIACFRDINDYHDDMKNFIKIIKNSEPRTDDDVVLYPGEKDGFTRSDRVKNGVPIYTRTLKDLEVVSRDLGVDPIKILG